MQIQYDAERNRLVFLAEPASPGFWDRRWGREDLRQAVAESLS